MGDDLEYIEQYFMGRLSATERETFEKRCVEDPDFAREVGLYINMRAALRQTLVDEKKEGFRKLYQSKDSKEVRVLRPWSSGVMRYAAAAAACLLIVLVWMLFPKPASPKHLAAEYVKENFERLPATMSEGSDSLQQGIAAYNAKEYDNAESIFRALTKNKEHVVEATKNLGLTFLARGQYENALGQFTALSDSHDLFANPGPFYKAITLMQRSGPGDEEAAKLILQDVVKRRLPGDKVASGWLRRW